MILESLRKSAAGRLYEECVPFRAPGSKPIVMISDTGEERMGEPQNWLRALGERKEQEGPQSSSFTGEPNY